ncbi:MAG: hypothetical protein ACM3Q4_09980 [Acidobacteriota bacterium]
MKIMTIIAAFLFTLSVRVCAGEIFGAISEGEKAVGEKIKVEVAASGKSYAAETDKNGSYRLFVKEKGKCTFTVHYKDQSVSTECFSYDRSMRYDWLLELKDGKYQLKRK